MSGPTIRRRQLGGALRRLRADAHETREQTAFLLGCSATKVTYLESGRNVIGKTELIVLLQHYGVEDKLQTLEELRQEAGKRGWWSQYGLPEWLAGYVGLETDATSLRCLELENIPGLLQTEQYMRTLYTVAGRLSAKEVNRRVPARLKRQERLTGESPLPLTAVVSQAALERCGRDDRVAADQLAQLLDRAQWPNIELRVLPFDQGLHAGTDGPFSLLSFRDEELLPDIAYQEYAVGGHVIDDEAVVSQLVRLFDELRSQSLDADESLAMIAQLAQQIQ
ncbi:MAG TPA: helix-turn-helix transcriptional regulator [Pseudonocardiaceae bacterium]|jgi:transcriptional regulator with XRE-family HTH domain|nr:helix-turn-helix transcriptional regulator [Pseudonocardiaceae bacterium]